MGHPLTQPFDVDSNATGPDGSNVDTPASGVSPGNSSTSTLGANETFTGSWVDVEQWDAVRLTVRSDQPSASSGVRIQYSTDGNSVEDETRYTYPSAGTGESRVYTDPMRFQYVRIVYDNGSNAQGSFFLRTYIVATGTNIGTKALDIQPNADEIAAIVNGQLMGRQGNSGNFQFVDVVNNRLISRSQVQDSGGVLVDPATQALENALQANAADEYRARLHDSAGTQIDPLNQDALQSVGGDELRARVHDSTGTQIDPLNQDALQSVGGDELRARVHDSAGTQIDPLNQDALQTVGNDEIRARVFDTGGGQVDPFDRQETTQRSQSTSTATNNVSVDLGSISKRVGIVADVSGSATLTIEVSSSGAFAGEEHAVQTVSYSSAGVNLEQFEFAFQFVRARVDQNLNTLEIAARGV